MTKTLRILGTRGIPAAHGGFETFAERLALYLVQRGWRVVVYGQEDGSGEIFTDTWEGVERVHVPADRPGPLGTVVFDWKATWHAARHSDLCLTLGYNTAAFCALLKVRGVPNVINMDGIEWSRAKWGKLAKTWFWMNDWAGCLLADHLVADHPEIKRHLATRVSPEKISTIAYGGESVRDAPDIAVRAMGLVPGRYLTVVARPEPENSLLEIVQGFSCRPRGLMLLVLGGYEDGNSYHRQVRAAASDEVRFVGGIYDKPLVEALRFHSAAYVHGHQVGGTNPSLVEAMGAGNAVIAHDNPFNRSTAGPAARYFSGADGFAATLNALLIEPETLATMRMAARARFEAAFTWPDILYQYEALLARYLPVR
jgi:glycosyltransferase involved in cell wall biosynthesis